MFGRWGLAPSAYRPASFIKVRINVCVDRSVIYVHHVIRLIVHDRAHGRRLALQIAADRCCFVRSQLLDPIITSYCLVSTS
jgi:hypothetical protein